MRSVDKVTMVTTSKGERSWKCENWRLKNSCIQWNIFLGGWGGGGGGVSQLFLSMLVASKHAVWKRRKIQFWIFFWNCLCKRLMIWETVLGRKYSKIFQDARIVFVLSTIWVCLYPNLDTPLCKFLGKDGHQPLPKVWIKVLVHHSSSTLFG